MIRRRTPVRAGSGLCAVATLALLSGCSGHAPVAALPTVPVAVASSAPAVASAPAPQSSQDIAVPDLASVVEPAFAAAKAQPPAKAAAQAKANPKAGRLAGLTIVLDAGHNGGNSADPARLNAPVPAGGFDKPCNTAGTETNAGYPEHAFTYDVVSRTAALLTAEGAKVVLTRRSDTGFGPCVNKRAAIGNAAHADAVVVVHADGAAAGQTGFHVIAPALAPDHGNQAILASSWQLAVALHDAFHLATGENNASYVSGGLIRRSDLAGLNLSHVPAVFIECANMRNASDAAKVISAAWREKAAAGIVAGITAFEHR